MSEHCSEERRTLSLLELQFKSLLDEENNRIILAGELTSMRY